MLEANTVIRIEILGYLSTEKHVGQSRRGICRVGGGGGKLKIFYKILKLYLYQQHKSENVPTEH